MAYAHQYLTTTHAATQYLSVPAMSVLTDYQLWEKFEFTTLVYLQWFAVMCRGKVYKHSVAV